MNETIKLLTNQRERLDAIKTAISKLPKSRGVSLAYTALEKGRMYLGEVCRELGKDYPYEATKKATSAEDIQDAVDISEKVWNVTGSEVIDLNSLRSELETELEEFTHTIFKVNGLSANFKPDLTRNKFIMDCSISEAYRGLKESRMYLGIRLGEIRDNFKKD